MCGIIGVLGQEAAAPRVIEALRRLEYRGYDSAGVATLESGVLTRVRAPGKLKNLDAKLVDITLNGTAGIGHTRWATHGPPTEKNAHPHSAGRVCIVHNGIIENFVALRRELEGEGHVFETETDTETIAHLLSRELEKLSDPAAALKATLAKLDGAFAIAVLIEGEEDLMLGARKGSPLVIGVGENEMFLGSDALAVAPFTNRVIYLEEGDWCVLSRANAQIFDANGAAVQRPVSIVQTAGASVEKGNYRHFMQKEIYEQPDSTARTIGAYVDALHQSITLPEANPGAAEVDFAKFDRLHMVACGTAYYACCVAEYWFEQIAGLSVKTDIASEFRYREPVLGKNDIALFVSQSGETADTLAAMRYCKEHGLTTAGVLNVTTSSIAREVDIVLPTLAGPEIGVASTKAFTAQLCALAAVVISAARQRGQITEEEEKKYAKSLTELPRLISKTLGLDDTIAKLSRDLSKARDVIYLGRGVHYPIALEGALKLKEISYIHAEGYASGELKHGPIALIDEETPVVFVAPHDSLFEKSLSNLQEVAARRGRVVLVSNVDGITAAGDAPVASIEVPDCDPFIAPVLYSLPVQMLAYHIAVEKGTDVDQPRNLAKSVTVE